MKTSNPYRIPLPALVLILALIGLALPLAGQQAVSFSKSFAPGTIGPGSVSTLSFFIVNSSSSAVRNLAFTDNLPAGVTIAAAPQATSSCLGILEAPAGGGTITFSDGGIGGASSCTITVDVTSSTVGTHTNVSGDLTSDAGNSGSATANLIVATDRPGFTKSFSPNSVFFNGRSTLTFTIDNVTTASVFNPSFTDNLPAGMTVANPNNASSTCPGLLNAPAGSSFISLSPNFSSPVSIPPGNSCTISVDVIGGSVGSLGNTTGELTSAVGGPTRSSGKAAATLEVTTNRLLLTKEFTDDPVPQGGTVTLQFTVNNFDRLQSATSIQFTDDLEAALSGLVATGLPAGNVCGAGSQLSGTSVLSLTGGSLPAEGTCTFDVTLQVPAAAPAGSYDNTTSQVSADLGGQPVLGAPASDTLFVSLPAPILTKTFVDDPVGGGGAVELEFTITNPSTVNSAAWITFEDVFDTILQTASSVPADGFCGSASSADFTPLTSFNPARLFVSGASLGPGQSCTFSVLLDVVTGAPAGLYPNTTGAVAATVAGQLVFGSPASDVLEVVEGPRLTKEFTDDPVVPGGTVTLEFTLIQDPNAEAATDINFSDDLNATLSGLTATGLPASNVCGAGSELSGTTNLMLTGGSLAPGESCTFSASLAVPNDAPAGNHDNTTSDVISTVLGATVVSPAATDVLKVAGLLLTKEFTDDPVLPGDTVTLQYTIENISPIANATGIAFSDNLGGALDNLAAVGGQVPQSGVCGAGSSLVGVSNDRQLVFSDGSLGAGESCTFSVLLQVPAAAEPDQYASLTSSFRATIDGALVLFDNARDTLEVTTQLVPFDKEFLDDPVGPGGTVTLRFTITNPNDVAISNLAFTDDLDAVLSGLTAADLPASDVCGGGSTLSGTTVIQLSGGSVPANSFCAFDVSLAVPANAPAGVTVTNTTSDLTGTLKGFPVTGDPASDDLEIGSLTFTKEFGSEVQAGDLVTLTFHIANDSAAAVDRLEFTDDLGAVLSGLVAVGLPQSGICGSDSTLEGTSLLRLTNGLVMPGGSCTFSAQLQVPAGAPGGDYENVTSNLFSATLSTGPATATLTIIEVVDEDGDGVLDPDDFCPGTVIPEGVPTERLGTNRFALVDGDGIFDTNPPPGGGPGAFFTIQDTAGCSCEQIIVAQGLGKGHVKFGCSLGEMRAWVELVNP